MSAKGKTPWITYQDEDVADSSFCVKYLNKKFSELTFSANPTHTHIRTHAHAHKLTQMHAHARKCAFTHAHAHKCTQTHAHTCTHTHTRTCQNRVLACACARVCVCACVQCACACLCVRVHTFLAPWWIKLRSASIRPSPWNAHARPERPPPVFASLVFARGRGVELEQEPRFLFCTHGRPKATGWSFHP